MGQVLRSCATVAAVVVTLTPVTGQVRPLYDRGAAGLTQALQRLHTTASVLHTGAHPDDEDSAFLARAARGDHARVAYLSLTRGEGGQNVIGPELAEGLGVIRTEELLQARRLDGAGQFFTRAFDYGFSKTLDEARTKWNERELLGDMVRIIRVFRPLVVYSRFSGTPADGHGHHQMAGYLTPLAVRAAADPSQFPEQIREGLRPWQVRKVYRGAGGRAEPNVAAALVVDTGVVDPAIGRSFAEIAFEGRSQHKTQEMGSLERRGAVISSLRLIDGRGDGQQPERSVFDGIDITVPGLARLAGLPAGSLAPHLQAIEESARSAERDYRPLAPARLVSTLARGLRAVRAARLAAKSAPAPEPARAEADFLLAIKENDFVDALTRAAGVVVDPLADAETVVPGGSFGVTVRTFLPAGAPVAIASTQIHAPAGWSVTPDQQVSQGGPFGARELATHETTYRIVAAVDAPATQPYFLEGVRAADGYAPAHGALSGLPFAPPLLRAAVTMAIDGTTVTVVEPILFRYADRVRGEIRRTIGVVPPVTVGLDSPLMVVPLGDTPLTTRVSVRAASHSARTVSGRVRLRLPPGWEAAPGDAPLLLTSSGDVATMAFTVTAPANRTAGQYELSAEAIVDGVSYTLGSQEIAYPHIQTHRIFRPAVGRAHVFDIKVTPVRVGYIMGTGDQVPEALRRLGIAVTPIDDDLLATGDLSQFDTIMVGIRATEGRRAFAASRARLMDYMERGGTLVVQYQQTDYASRNLPPYPAQATSNSRVTDETAPVRILAPEHPLFTFPNRISAADFEGWVQERNLYAFTGFDSRYVPLLESADRGEPTQRGAALYARVGNGHYVYTAYSWFRQLPAGVPGAYRQLANLVSLPLASR